VVQLGERGDDLLWAGKRVGLMGLGGLWGEQQGPLTTADVTGHVGLTGGGGCPRALLVCLQLWRRHYGGLCKVPGFLCGPQRAGW